MTKEEYLNKGKELNGIISDARVELVRIRENYISDNRKFNDGDLVSVVSYSNKLEHGFVRQAIEYNGDVRYRFVKQKKDGMASSLELHVSYHDCQKTTLIQSVDRVKE